MLGVHVILSNLCIHIKKKNIYSVFKRTMFLIALGKLISWRNVTNIYFMYNIVKKKKNE